MISFDNLSPFKQSQSSWFYLEKVSKFHLHFDSCIPVYLELVKLFRILENKSSPKIKF